MPMALHNRPGPLVLPCRLRTGSSGPGLLCKAMDIDRRLNGHDFSSDELHMLARPEGFAAPVVHRPRIGVDYAGEWAARPLRFYLEGNSHVSRK